VVVIPTAEATVAPGQNLAGEPRDTLTGSGLQLDPSAVTPVGNGVDLHTLRLRGAFARTVAMAGAMEAASRLTTLYATQREQFGRSIAAFQAVQHHLVVLASEASAASMAADLATTAYEGRDPEFAVPAAKIQAGAAAAAVTAAAHQVHGAIGMTQEYQLHRHTRALWAWRQEFGSEAWWSDHLGEKVCAFGADSLWPLITSGRFDL
jgi:acyl-CoA dehydrogenase